MRHVRDAPLIIVPINIAHLFVAINDVQIQVAARSEAWVCGSSPAGIAGSNPVGGMDMSLVSVVCCQVEVSATG